MKKRYFNFLLLPLWGLGGLFGNFASAQVSVKLMGETYTVPPQVSFTVSWGAKAPYDNKIWALVQYAKVSASGIGPEARALVTAVSKVAGAGTVSTVPEADHRGFWLKTPGNNGSATITATLSLASGVEQFNWCVYAFDYPPNAILQPDGTYQLRGTKPFKVNGGNLAADAGVYSGYPPITAFTDATDCPGIWDPPCTPGSIGNAGACIGFNAGKIGS
jgi:hypothetical protein